MAAMATVPLIAVDGPATCSYPPTARVLPSVAVVLFTMSPLFAIAVLSVMLLAGLDAGP